MGICLVTGGGSGIGLATAKILLNSHNVVICGRDSKKLEKAKQEISKDAKHELITIQADLTKKNEVNSLFKKIKDTKQEFIACVNNAAILLKKSFINTDYNDWQYTINSNLTSAYSCCHNAFMIMKEQEKEEDV